MKNIFSKEELVSMSHTFIATFITVLASAITMIPTETWTTPNVWTTSFWAAIILAAVRSTVKILSPIIVENIKKLISK